MNNIIHNNVKELSMSKKLMAFLLTFGFASGFVYADAPVNKMCFQDCIAFEKACVARGYGTEYCSDAFQNCLTVCDNSVAP
jgi:hypothetical protein